MTTCPIRRTLAAFADIVVVIDVVVIVIDVVVVADGLRVRVVIESLVDNAARGSGS